MFEDLHRKQRQKMNKALTPKKALHVKKISSSQNGQYLSTRRQNSLKLFISDVLSTFIIVFRA